MANCRKETKAYENKLKYIRKYTKENYKYKNFSFNTKNSVDVKIMEYLETKESQSSFVKELIYQYMINNGILEISQSL